MDFWAAGDVRSSVFLHKERQGQRQGDTMVGHKSRR